MVHTNGHIKCKQHTYIVLQDYNQEETRLHYTKVGASVLESVLK